MSEIYQRLAVHLDRLPVPFPSTETGLEFEILRKWFSQQHAEIALNMKGVPEPVSVIAERLGVSAETLAPVLEDMSKKGLIFRMAHTNFYAACNDDDCTACGICVDRCPMEAIELEDAAVVNRDRCVGCGVCVVVCDVDAMVLHPKKAQEQYLPPKDIVDMQHQIAKERGLF